MNPNGLPFWDQQKLEENDSVFVTPTRDNLRLLKVKYGVRWLYADPTQTVVSPGSTTSHAPLQVLRRADLRTP